jgi:hypothetical protein
VIVGLSCATPLPAPVLYPGYDSTAPLSDRTHHYHLCETGERTVNRFGIPHSNASQGQACWIISTLYQPGTEGWYRYVWKSCDLGLPTGCLAPAEAIAAQYRRDGDFYFSYFSGVRHRKFPRPAPELVVAARERFTRHCDRSRAADDFNGREAGTICMAAALLHDVVEPRSEKRAVLALMERACHAHGHVRACDHLNERYGRNINTDAIHADNKAADAAQTARQLEASQRSEERRHQREAEDAEASRQRAQATEDLGRSLRESQDAYKRQLDEIARGVQRPAPPRTATPPTPATPPSRGASAPPRPVAGSPAAAPPASSAPSPAPPPVIERCPSVGCVSMAAKHPKGAGHCEGELTGKITNNCSEAVYCHFEVADTGKSRGATRVPAGATVGGEMGGIYTCGASPSATWKYQCTTVAAKNRGCRQ